MESFEKKEINSLSNCFNDIVGLLVVVVVEDERNRCDKRLAKIP